MLWATIIEVVVLAFTAMPVLNSIMAHTASSPDSTSNNRLALIGIYFHMPSFLILEYFGNIFCVPVIQIILMGLFIFLVSLLRRRLAS